MQEDVVNCDIVVLIDHTASASSTPYRPRRLLLKLEEILSGHFSLQASKLSSAQKQTRSEDVCLLLGRVALPQRVQRYVTTAHILRQYNGQHGNTTTV
ncbi:hypothetical protein PAMP_019718 [Pampus punctatissimus]